MRTPTLALTSLLAALPGAASRAEILTVPEAVVRVVSRAAGPNPALIVGLHGYGARETQIATLLPVDIDVPHVYVALRAPLAMADGGYAWFEVSTDADGITVAPGAVEQAFDDLAQRLPHIAAETGVSARNVHVVGYSQGGTLALAFALQRPDALASAASFSGALPPGLAASSDRAPLPVLVAHGTRDALISKGEIATTRDALSSHGRVVTAFDEDVPHVVGNVGRREADFAVRLDNNPPNTLVGKRLYAYTEAAYATPDYLSRDPRSYRWLGWGTATQGAPQWVRTSEFPDNPAWGVFPTIPAQHAAAREGLGIAILPCLFGDADPDLQRAGKRAPVKSRDIWLLTHNDLRQTARVQAFMGFAEAVLRKHRKRLIGEA